MDDRRTRLTNPQRPAPNPKNYEAGGTALQTGMPVFRSAPPAKMVDATGHGGCRSTGRWPSEAFLAPIAVSKHSEHMPLNRQAQVMARHDAPIDRSVLADWKGRTGALITPVVDRMAVLLKQGGARLYVVETTAQVLDPGRGKLKPAFSGPCCAMTAAGTALHHRA